MVDPVLLLPAPPPNDHPDNEMWVDEQIWGHRLWDSQSPWLLFLECLNIAEACQRDNQRVRQASGLDPVQTELFEEPMEEAPVETAVAHAH